MDILINKESKNPKLIRKNANPNLSKLELLVFLYPLIAIIDTVNPTINPNSSNIISKF